MATDIRPAAVAVPPLRHGDRMDVAEFERRWDAMPEVKKAELIDGVVYMTPVSAAHGVPHFNFNTWLGLYQLLTPGVEGADNTSVRVGPRNMPQPDTLLRVLESYGGRSRVGPDGLLEGGPELAAEVSVTTTAHDLGAKREVYRRLGVQEYLVWRVEDRAVDWFVLRGGVYVPLAPGPDGVFRSEVFPGLWLNPAALIAGDAAALLRTAQEGHGTPEHAAFIRELERRAAGG